MVLHLLLGFKPLLALLGIALELKAFLHHQIVIMDLTGRSERAVSNFTRLYETFYSAFIAKMRTTEFRYFRLVRYWA